MPPAAPGRSVRPCGRACGDRRPSPRRPGCGCPRQLQDVHQITPFELVERRQIRNRPCLETRAPRADRQRQIADLDDTAPAEEPPAAPWCSQLAHVARPGVAASASSASGANVDASSGARAGASRNARDQQRDVLAAARAAAARDDDHARAGRRGPRGTARRRPPLESPLVAATIRTSTLTTRAAPTGRTSAPEHPQQLGLQRRRMSPISSRNTCRRRPARRALRRRSAPVNAPRVWPNSSDSSSVSAIAAQLTATNGRARAGRGGESPARPVPCRCRSRPRSAPAPPIGGAAICL